MLKITLIGAGSTVFAKNLISDILQFPELSEVTICLHDIDRNRLHESELIAHKIVKTLKVNSTIGNARGVLDICAEFGSLDTYLWRFVDGMPLQNEWAALAEIPAKTELSDSISKDLKKRGFRFVGSTICYAFMQAVGMVNDHLLGCPRRKACARTA